MATPQPAIKPFFHARQKRRRKWMATPRPDIEKKRFMHARKDGENGKTGATG
jgi:hypothetical protein